jgi:hypothetical protein
VQLRIRLDGDAATVLCDTFNDPSLALPLRGEAVAITFPSEARVVLGVGQGSPTDADGGPWARAGAEASSRP